MIAEIIDTKTTPARKRARGVTISGSDVSPPNDIVSSPHGANQGHDAKRVKGPVAVRWESGLTRYADDEEFVPADGEDEDAAETPSRGSGAASSKKVRFLLAIKSSFLQQLGLTHAHQLVIMPLPKSVAEFSKADKYLWDKRAVSHPSNLPSSHLIPTRTLSPTPLPLPPSQPQLTSPFPQSGTSYELILPTFRTLALMPSMGHSTLATRYVRLQALFATWPAADDALLLRAKKTVEEMVEKEKWNWVKTVMEKERGGGRHEGKWEKVALRKRWEVLVGGERKGYGAVGQDVDMDEERGEAAEDDKGKGGRGNVGEYHGNGNGHEEDDEEKS